uniref:Reverse transcriptase domain-containing protein n=1 Tax=Eptatretus burgeri TaxID=7764 RepID=A0A8C4QF08_EPTBU
MKLLERILDGRIKKSVEMEIGEEQQGFRNGRGTTDGMFPLRQLVEKRLEVQGGMALEFVDLEKAYNTVPREIVIATLTWIEVPEAGVRLVEGMYKGTKGRVLVGPGMSVLSVNIGLRQGSFLSQLMFITVMELVSKKVSLRGSIGRILYADDLAVVGESERKMQEVVGECTEVLGKYELNISMEKTEVMWVGQQRK